MSKNWVLFLVSMWSLDPGHSLRSSWRGESSPCQAWDVVNLHADLLKPVWVVVYLNGLQKSIKTVIMNVIACKQFLGWGKNCVVQSKSTVYMFWKKKKLNKKYNHFCLTTCTFLTSCLTHTARDQVLRVLNKKHNHSEDSYAKVNADKTLCLTVNC